MIDTTQALEISQPARFAAEVVDRVLARYALYPYRHWLGFGQGVPRELVRWGLLNAQQPQASWCWLATDGSEPVGLAHVIARPWESEQLGRPIAELRDFITVGDVEQRRSVAQVLLEAIRQRLSGMVACLVHHVDIADHPTIGALEGCGWRLVDTTMSFIRGRDFRPYLQRTFRRPCPIRPYREEDWPAVEAIARQSCFGGRLYNDSGFTRDRVDALYLEWARLCCQRVFADEVIVALRHDHIGGFLSYQFQRGLFEAAGIRLVGRGLLAVGAAHRGLALELIRGASLTELRADFLQCDIHVENADLMGLYGRVLRMSVAHVRHAFHWWLDAPADAPIGP